MSRGDVTMAMAVVVDGTAGVKVRRKRGRQYHDKGGSALSSNGLSRDLSSIQDCFTGRSWKICTDLQ
jgi:hypothetical protein